MACGHTSSGEDLRHPAESLLYCKLHQKFRSPCLSDREEEEDSRRHTLLEKVQSLLQSLQSVYEKELQKVMTGETNPTRTYKSEWRWFLFLDSFIRNHVLQKDSQPEPVNSKDMSSSSSKAAADNGGDDDTDDDAGHGVDSSQEDRFDTATRQTARSRPVRASRKHRAARVVNGDGESGDDDNWQPSPSSRHSPRKKQKTSVSSVGDSVRESTRRSSGSKCASKSSNGYPRGQAEDSASVDSRRISAQMAESLRSVQTLLAKTLSDHDQPSMVFARHITNELDLIPDYVQRKQCMLDIQRVILRYQAGHGKAVNVKAERGCEDVGKDSGVVITGSEPAASSSADIHQVDESLPLYFDLQSG
ncbi:uncharacterized protein [Littorina saxatilis]|uniref:uncharacterized protein isoform X3 n=1 Tax=Littorina saxatilis TaxID=31220 RepID=UPI0038B5C2BE